jgi:uncharacterized protein
MKDFEWDDNIRILNIKKHKIDFFDILDIFQDPVRIERSVTRKDEPRYETIGIIEDVVLFVVYTFRGVSRRIISARRASKDERKIYEISK